MHSLFSSLIGLHTNHVGSLTLTFLLVLCVSDLDNQMHYYLATEWFNMHQYSVKSSLLAGIDRSLLHHGFISLFEAYCSGI